MTHRLLECRQFWRLREDLPDTEKPDQAIPQLHRHPRLSETKRTAQTAWLLILVLGEAFLRLQTKGARAFAIGQKSAEWVLSFATVEGKSATLGSVFYRFHRPLETGDRCLASLIFRLPRISNNPGDPLITIVDAT